MAESPPYKLSLLRSAPPRVSAILKGYHHTLIGCGWFGYITVICQSFFFAHTFELAASACWFVGLDPVVFFDLHADPGQIKFSAVFFTFCHVWQQ